jgi:hypothetical protein
MIMRIMMIRPHNLKFKSIWDFRIVFWFGDETTFIGICPCWLNTTSETVETNSISDLTGTIKEGSIGDP